MSSESEGEDEFDLCTIQKEEMNTLAKLAPPIEIVNELHQSTCDLVSKATYNDIHSLEMPHECHVIKTDIVFDEDDGWLSDQDNNTHHNGKNLHIFTCIYLYVHAIGQFASIFVDNEALVEEVRTLWLQYCKQRSPELVDLLQRIFEEHEDVYSLVVSFLKKTGKTG